MAQFIHAEHDWGNASGLAEAFDLVRFRLGKRLYIVDVLRETVESHPIPEPLSEAELDE